jgi:hypothetical protein
MSAVPRVDDGRYPLRLCLYSAGIALAVGVSLLVDGNRWCILGFIIAAGFLALAYVQSR